MFRSTLRINVALVFMVLSTAALAEAPRSSRPPADVWAAPELGDIRVEGLLGRRIDATLQTYMLHHIDIDSALKPFVTGRMQEGQRFIGIGMFLDALVSYQEYTHGDPEVLALKDRILNSLLGVQGEDGYIGFFEGKDRIQANWSAHELAYIIQAMVHDFTVNREERSLQGAIGATDFIVDNWADSNRPWWDRSKYLGVPKAMLMMHEVTGDPRYLDFVTGTLKVQEWDSRIQSHTYTYLSHVLEHVQLYRLTGDRHMLEVMNTMLDFITRRDGMLVTGGVSQSEFWHDSQEGSGNSVETCAVVYLLRCLQEKLLIDPDAQIGDMVERVLFNALPAVQSPDCRQIHYHTPMEGPRSWFENEFYCCPNNLRRFMPLISKMIYYTGRDKPELIVNQYIASTGTISLSDGVTVEVGQTTDYPYRKDVAITISPEAESRFTVKLRIPSWCNERVEVTVNDQPVDGVTPGDYLAIDRVWRPGDRIALRLPLYWRIIAGRKVQAGRYALLRGPVVYVLNPELNSAVIKRIPEQLYHRIVIDPNTIEMPEPQPDAGSAYHPATVKGWWPGSVYRRPTPDTYPPTNFVLTLTEFADPGGRLTYFEARSDRDITLIGSDELFD